VARLRAQLPAEAAAPPPPAAPARAAQAPSKPRVAESTR